MAIRADAERFTGLALPIGILSIVAKQLVAEGSYATCASLNVTCQAVHEKTLQSLWKVNVQWAIKMIRMVPADVPINTPASPRTLSYRPQLREVHASWNRLVNSRGARYIEFLAVPQFQHGSIPMAQLGRRLNGLPGAGAILPKLKAVITLSDNSSGSGPTSRYGGFIHTTVLYGYGGEDLFHVCDSISQYALRSRRPRNKTYPEPETHHLLSKNAGITFLQ
ncbi:hypothetical protein QFC22_001658 [Naganishia vaughanmartiniae]|uniref:Uncharacterized protein n=1 Tax=Naganishia vaughanmartiniae TaxID=1424756 RepID=A0ACC2XF32_9TREE|nr:hypothetical protein QFC22_001658 [Naganishia vaughanmartiniae]